MQVGFCITLLVSNEKDGSKISQQKPTKTFWPPDKGLCITDPIIKYDLWNKVHEKLLS